jgi:outer membrane protein TolC
VKLGVQQNFTWNITVNQLIFSGEYIVGLQASRTFKELSERNLLKTKNETKEAVAKAYYMVLTGEENLSILRQSLQLIDKTLNDVTAMFKQGFVEETDVDQIKINKLNLENLVNSVTEQVQIAYRLLKFQMGLDVNQPIELTDKLDELIAQGNFKLWSQDEFDVQKNIDMKIMQTNEALSMLNLQREKSKFLPSVSAFYQHQEQLKKPQFNFTIPDIAGVGISWPLFTSGGRNSKVAQARLALEKTTIGKNQVRDGLLIDFEQSRNTYNKALNDYLTLKENLNLSDKIYRKTLLKYSQGMASGMELTQAQNQFLTTESNYYNAVLSLFNAQAKLEKLLETN